MLGPLTAHQRHRVGEVGLMHQSIGPTQFPDVRFVTLSVARYLCGLGAVEDSTGVWVYKLDRF